MFKLVKDVCMPPSEIFALLLAVGMQFTDCINLAVVLSFCLLQDHWVAW